MSVTTVGPIDLVRDGRRFRVMKAGETLADSVAAQLLCERGRHPVIYFPPADVRRDLLRQSDLTTRCPHKGEASYWTIELSGSREANAVWSYESPTAGLGAIAGYLAFDWTSVDSFWHEEQELLAHPRNPFVRIDTLRASRRVVVTAAGEVLADSQAPVMLFETGLPTRYYLPRADVALDLLAASPSRSVCPYKGEASYFTAKLGGGEIQDIAWTYPEPFAEVTEIKDCVCFYPERVDSIEVAPR